MGFKTQKWKTLVSSLTLANDLVTRQEGPVQPPSWKQRCAEPGGSWHSGPCYSPSGPLGTAGMSLLSVDGPRIQILPMQLGHLCPNGSLSRIEKPRLKVFLTTFLRALK